MSPRGLRLSAVALVPVVAVVLLAACSTDPGEEMTPQQSREMFMTVVRDTAALLSEDGWAEISPPSWASCAVGGGEGAKTDWFYARDPLTDHAANAKKVADYWASLGMRVRTVSEPNYSVYATGGGIDGVAFHTAPGLYGISGSSLCVPGDSFELMKQDNAKR